MIGTDANELMLGLAPFLRVRPLLDDICRFGGDWAAPHDQADGAEAWFHIITRGNCRLERTGEGRLDLSAGDILLLPRGDAHVVRSPRATGSALRPISTEYRNAIRLKTTGDSPADTEIVCGRLAFEAPDNPLLAILPPAIVLRTTEDRCMSRLSLVLGAIRDELDEDRPGCVAIATELATALFLMLIRLYLEDEAPVAGMPALLADRMTARAVTAILNDITRAWTLEELAEEARTSRATLVRTFRRLAGHAPLEFLAELRLGIARGRLATSNDPIRVIAEQAGYGSEATFSRAFHRRYGTRPTALRTGLPAGMHPGAARCSRPMKPGQTS
jgi:AraC family transcriptional regulator, activator of mtrCDE